MNCRVWKLESRWGSRSGSSAVIEIVTRKTGLLVWLTSGLAKLRSADFPCPAEEVYDGPVYVLASKGGAVVKPVNRDPNTTPIRN
jgi:hypothetical protein